MSWILAQQNPFTRSASFNILAPYKATVKQKTAVFFGFFIKKYEILQKTTFLPRQKNFLSRYFFLPSTKQFKGQKTIQPVDTFLNKV